MLQVPETIKALLDAGMNVWVLTGDKMEVPLPPPPLAVQGHVVQTAINIGMACNLLESTMEAKGNLLRIGSCRVVSMDFA